MNSSDTFKKLIIGTKFDYKKYAKDVKKFSVNKFIENVLILSLNLVQIIAEDKRQQNYRNKCFANY